MLAGQKSPFVGVSDAYSEQHLSTQTTHQDLRQNTYASFSLLSMLLATLSLVLVFQLLTSSTFHQQQTLFGGLSWLTGQILLFMLLKQGIAKNIVINLSMLLTAVVLNTTAWTSAGIVAIETPMLLLIPLIVLSVQGFKAGLVWFFIVALNILALPFASSIGAKFDIPDFTTGWYFAAAVFLIVVMSSAFGLIHILQRENEKLQSELKQLVTYHQHKGAHDGLTQFLNKESFKDVFERMILRAKHQNESMTLLIVDLNKFKLINDKYGHLTGDKVLKGVAHNLSLGLRPDDIAGRIGGDEFAIALDNTNAEYDLESRIVALKNAIKQPISTRVGPISVEAEIGSSVFAKDGECFETLYEAADKSMYEGKQQRPFKLVD